MTQARIWQTLSKNPFRMKRNISEGPWFPSGGRSMERGGHEQTGVAPARSTLWPPLPRFDPAPPRRPGGPQAGPQFCVGMRGNPA